MKRKRHLLLLTLILASLFSQAQKPVSLKEAIDYTLANHGSNVIYNNKIELTRQQAKEALSAYLPQVNGTVTWDNNLKNQTTVIPAGIFGPEELKVQFGNKYNTNAVVQMDQTIYDQGLLYGLKANGPNQKIAELNKSKNDEDLIYNTATAYSQILVLKEQQQLLAANEKQYKELYDITKLRFDKGVAKRVDLDKVTVNLNNVQAQEKLIQTKLDVAYNTLKNSMGLPLDTALVITDTLDFSRYQMLPQENMEVKNQIDYQLQQQNISLQQLDVKRKQAAYLPTVSAYARYGDIAFGNQFGKSVSDWNYYAAIGLKVNVPIFSSNKKKSQLAQSRIELDNANEQLKLSEKSLQLDFQNANRALQETITNLTTNRNNMELAQRVYQTSQLEYQKGVSSMSDLLTSDYSYKQAQADYITSLLNLVGSRLAYERAKGSIKEFINQL